MLCHEKRHHERMTALNVTPLLSAFLLQSGRLCWAFKGDDPFIPWVKMVEFISRMSVCSSQALQSTLLLIILSCLAICKCVISHCCPIRPGAC
jgi:hypothetical protein